jgi:hypothetical protein
MNKKYFVLGVLLAAMLRANPDITIAGMYADPMGYKKYVTLSERAIHITHVVGGSAPMHTTEIVRKALTDKYGGLIVWTDKSIYKIYTHGKDAWMLYANDIDGTPRAALILRRGQL